MFVILLINNENKKFVCEWVCHHEATKNAWKMFNYILHTGFKAKNLGLVR